MQITKAPKKLRLKKNKKKGKAKFKFSSDESGSSFECKLDKGAFSPCSSPFKVKLKKGTHRFKVRATDAAGNSDRASAKVKVKKRR